MERKKMNRKITKGENLYCHRSNELILDNKQPNWKISALYRNLLCMCSMSCTHDNIYLEYIIQKYIFS